MTGKKVVFIEPAGARSNVFENFMGLPLMGTVYLGTILHNAGYNVRIYNENVLSRPIDPFEIEADVFCLSALTVSSNRARLLAREIRRINPGCRIIVGGIHASLKPEDFEDVADQVVYGEAENVIIDAIEGNISAKLVQGSLFEDLNKLPPANYRLLEGWQSITVVPVMTSRGCPFDCSFCTVTKIFGKRFRMQTPERIIQELRNIQETFPGRSIFFYDDNFTANPNRIKNLCRLLEPEKYSFNWSAQVRQDIARDPELVDMMERAGCRRVYIGFESINDESLKAMHKAQTRKDIEHAIRVIRGRGIAIHGMFIFGEDLDTPLHISATVDFAIRQKIDTVQFMILTPFPGTRIFDYLESQNRLLHRRWDYYDAMYTVFRPRNMSPARLQEETLRAYRRFYSLSRVLLDALRLFLDVLIDAFTLNFRRVFQYTFESLFLQMGGRFIVSRYSRTFDPYIQFLSRIEEKEIFKGS